MVVVVNHPNQPQLWFFKVYILISFFHFSFFIHTCFVKILVVVVDDEVGL